MISITWINLIFIVCRDYLDTCKFYNCPHDNDLDRIIYDTVENSSILAPSANISRIIIAFFKMHITKIKLLKPFS
ncbi:MAG: hypothetical protein CMIDDMOC_00922 [Sodalis sp. Fle]|nr:MAG: hypothetical protein CMIDDMOC_00922 [Sodalis sp. Fle]